MTRGRRPTTGRFDSRAELCREVWHRWLDTPSNIADIARACRVSQGVVHNILNKQEGKKVEA